MSTFSSFAVVGAGNLGSGVIKDLLELNASVVVLTRPSSDKKGLPGQAKVVPVAYDDKDAVTKVLRENKVQVLISTLSGEGLAAQEGLADASKAAGVQLFVPSEFGMPAAHEHGPLALKSKLQGHLTKLELPSTRIYTGGFTEYLPFGLSLDFTKGKVIYIVGKGDAHASFTSVTDITGYVAHILTSYPLSALANKELRIQGDRVTPNEVAKLYQAKGEVEVKYVEKVPDEVPMAAFRTEILRAIELGFCSTGWSVSENRDVEKDAGSGNALWEGHVWKSVKEVLKL